MSGDAILPRLPEPGAIVDGKYEIVGVVGRGGMGVVFEAIHLRVRRRVALKMLHPHVAGDPGVLERFEREARAAGQLGGPNIAHVIDVQTETELPFIVMEFLEGRDLEEELSSRGRLPIADAVDYVLQACGAMNEAHAIGIIHRDLKPANLFLCRTPDGPTIKVLDFGISKNTTEADGRLTAAMTTLGSPVYMSPEQLRGTPDVDARTDIWGLGVILYELIAGRPPHGGTVTAVTASIIGDAPPKLSGLRSELPEGLEAVVDRALAKDRDERYPDAQALADALLPFASPESAKRARAASALRAEPPSSRRRIGHLTPGDPQAVTVAKAAISSDGLPPAASETRHALSTARFAATLRPHSRARTFLIALAAIFVGAVVIVLYQQVSTGEAPSAAASPPPDSVSESASAAPAPSAPSAPSAEIAPPPAASSANAVSSASKTSAPRPAPAARGADTGRAAPSPKPAAPRPSPAATTNPLRL